MTHDFSLWWSFDYDKYIVFSPSTPQDILDLKGSTISEIRSYQSPPPPVHQIMIATLMLIGHREKELRNWQTVQATLGKTGKEGKSSSRGMWLPLKLNQHYINDSCYFVSFFFLPFSLAIKRRILACKPEYVPREAASRSGELLKGFDLVEIKDVSLGAGTFFVWASNMVESCLG